MRWELAQKESRSRRVHTLARDKALLAPAFQDNSLLFATIIRTSSFFISAFHNLWESQFGGSGCWCGVEGLLS